MVGMDELVIKWRKLRDELSSMLSSRNMDYPAAVKKYYKAHPRMVSDKGRKKYAEDEFVYANCVEKHYWKKKPKDGVSTDNDSPNPSRVAKAVVFLEKLKSFVANLDCDSPMQILAERFGVDFVNRFKEKVTNPINQEKENQLFSLPKNELGKDEFDE